MTSHLEYNEAPPCPEHAELIRCVWSLRGAGNGGPPEPIVSDGCVELVFNMADPFEQLSGDGIAAARQPLAMIVGPTARPTVVRPTGVIDVVGIRLQPWAAARVLRMPMSELRDRCVPLDDTGPRPLRELAERLHETPGDETRFGRASAAVVLSAVKPVEAISRHAVEQIPRASTPLTVRELARRLGRSVRTVQRVFAEDVGLAPKTLLRIARVQRALTLARSTPLRWSAIAAHAGYHDQPHFVRDFRSLVGCTPSEFRPDTLTASFISPGDAPLQGKTRFHADERGNR